MTRSASNRPGTFARTSRPASRPDRPPSSLEAYVLHQYDWSETSLILDLYTREQGRLAVAAKGAKRPYSQLRGVLLPFQRLQVALGRVSKADADDELSQQHVAEVQNLRSAEWAGGQAMLTGAALFSGFYLNELLMRLLPRHDPHASLFDVYGLTLRLLANGDDAGVQSALRAFELKLLEAVGLLPDLSLSTLTREEVRASWRYSLRPESGVGEGRGDGDLAGAALIGAQAALQHGSLPALQQACRMALPEWKTALRGLLHYHLGSPPLRTRQLMLDVQDLEP